MFLRLLLTASAAAALALAQGGSDMGGMSGKGAEAGGDLSSLGRNGMGRSSKPSPADLVVSKLKLTKDQTKEVETILEAANKEAAPLRQQLMQGRNALAGSMIAGKTEDVEKVQKAYAEAETQMTALEVKAFQKIYDLLKPNQTAKAGEAFDLMAGVFDPPTRRGMGFGMNRGAAQDMGNGSGNRGRGGR
jgi:Spy/CpxP family protein refolding chaperone